MNALSPQIPAAQSDTLLAQIVDAVVRAEQCNTADLPPLYDAIDPDALARMIEGPGGVEVAFRYLGHTVAVGPDGSVRVDEA